MINCFYYIRKCKDRISHGIILYPYYRYLHFFTFTSVSALKEKVKVLEVAHLCKTLVEGV